MAKTKHQQLHHRPTASLYITDGAGRSTNARFYTIQSVKINTMSRVVSVSATCEYCQWYDATKYTTPFILWFCGFCHSAVWYGRINILVQLQHRMVL